MEEDEPRSRLAQPDDLDLDEFFDTGTQESIVRNDDLEKEVPNEHKNHLLEVDRYWVNEPYAYVVIFKNAKQKEHQYYIVEPNLTPQEKNLVEFLKDKIRQSLDYDSIRAQAPREDRGAVIRDKMYDLLDNYNLLTDELTGKKRSDDPITKLLQTISDKIYSNVGDVEPDFEESGDGIKEQLAEKLDRRSAEKLIYYVIRDYIGYERIDGIMRDNYVEDVSQSGWNEHVFVQHSEYGTMITNQEFQRDNLDQFVTNLAQKAEKGISKRQPDVDATLEDGSRAILCLSDEITDDGSSFDIRKFTKIPFTPVDLVSWQTFSINAMVYLWMCVEAGKSAIIAGGTASGKTTTLNALSLFIPADEKTVSIEDTREINIPQKNWNPLTTREAFGKTGKGDIEEYRLLEDSLRMNPDYVIFGEVRGEEARDLFQNMNTGHTTFSTFHGKDSEAVRVRLTTEPINVDETTFSGLDLIITQEQVSISGNEERRCNSITELGEYNPDTEKFTVDEHFLWDSTTDEFDDDLMSEHMEEVPNLIDEIRHENGWNEGQLEDEINKRRVVLAYMIENGINSYTDVAAIIQGYAHDKANILSRIGEGTLKKDVDSLKQMRNLDLSVDDSLEQEVPRPEPSTELKQKARSILDNNQHIYEDVQSDVDLDNFSGVEERRLEGDMYKSESRVIDEEDMVDGTEDDTEYGFNEEVGGDETETTTDENGDVMDMVEEEFGEGWLDEDEDDDGGGDDEDENEGGGDGVWSDKENNGNEGESE